MLGSLLTSENRYTSIGRLVDAVWGTTPPDTASKQIRNAVSDLRAILAASGAVIVPVADGYRLDIGGAHLDLLEFHDRLTRARAQLAAGRPSDAIAEFRAALSLWNGPMLSGLKSDALEAQSAGVHETRLSVIEECVDLELAHGRHKALLGELADWVADHPLRERMVAQYVLALHRSGARARAFAVYEQTRRRLAEQLGLSPGPELTDVHRLMLREDARTEGPAADTAPGPAGRTARPAAVAAVHAAPAPVAAGEPGSGTGAGPWAPDAAPGFAPDCLPPDIAHFVGRAAEIRGLLLEAARPGARRVLAIDGMPGVGKTALAVHVAHRAAERFPDGRYFLDLRGHSATRDPLDRHAALRHLLLLSGAAPDSLPRRGEELAALWRARSTGLRALIVLDNAADAEQVRPLLPAGDGCLTLVTSRRRLTMTTWSATRVLSLDPLPRAEGYELFCLLLGKRHPRPEPAAVDGVLALCGDLPLAVSAAAARLRRRPSWPLAHLIARLAHPRQRLADLQTEQGGVAACFDASYRHLNTGRQRLLRILGAAGGDTTDVPTASALAGLPAFVAERMLEDLVDEHLLLQPEPGRYRMHPLVKAYCGALSHAPDTAHGADAPHEVFATGLSGAPGPVPGAACPAVEEIPAPPPGCPAEALAA
ncbi:BTAD domain-containing putative transcriptional regulator [Streptomyces sp. NPDC015131]|uniref:AfsR/SARP family transcriptional regulator n=1 Tax=Streptomyces sp. NPDC015131 TaxID=3364941 RepID=UPI0036F935B3